MGQNNIYHLIILDQSGSMMSIAHEAVGGLNETLGSIRATKRKNPQNNHFVTIVSFKGNGIRGVRTLRNRIPIDNIENISMSEYHPGACTPLYDAMGFSINRLKNSIPEDSTVLVTIITDGMENSSEKYSGRDIKTLVGHQREKGWTFAYIGANQDAVEIAHEMNIRNAMNFKATPEGTTEMAEKLSRSIVNFCCLKAMHDVDNFFGKD